MVRVTMDFVGTSTELSEKEIQSKVAFVIKDAMDTMAALCKRRA